MVISDSGGVVYLSCYILKISFAATQYFIPEGSDHSSS